MYILEKMEKNLDEILKKYEADLIILDLMMPEESGLQICQRLRVNEVVIPIIMLTAKGDEVDRIVGLEMGADDYLPKPFNPRELLARINAIIRRKETFSKKSTIKIISLVILFLIFKIEIYHKMVKIYQSQQVNLIY